MQLRPEDISEILRIFADSDLEELHLDVEGTRLDVSKSAGSLNRPAASGRSSTLAAPQTVPAGDGDVPVSVEAASTGDQVPANTESAAAASAGLHELRSPVLGVFYRRPAPGQAPFVEVGTQVGQDDAVCVVDVMKMFTKVSAGVAGRIAEICVEDGQLVEHGQVLMRIEPR